MHDAVAAASAAAAVATIVDLVITCAITVVISISDHDVTAIDISSFDDARKSYLLLLLWAPQSQASTQPTDQLLNSTGD